MAELYIGTSGFSYKEWKPDFYPADLSDKQFLQFYATQFNAVEIDSTFYRMPSEKTIQNWADATGEGFRFAIKASQQITHRERLKTPSEALDYFLRVTGTMGERLGVLLFQLPPFLKADHSRLETFLGAIPRGVPIVLEFRHDSWFTDETFALLRGAGAGLCIHDADEHSTPSVRTSNRVYVRLRKTAYDDASRRAWIDQFKRWRHEDAIVFVFIKHEGNPDAPKIAGQFRIEAER